MASFEIEKFEGDEREFAHHCAEALCFLMDALTKGHVSVEIKNVSDDKIRTIKQNKSYQKGCEIAAIKLNDGGWTRNKMFKIRQIELPYSREGFQEDVTKPFMEAAYQKTSSTQLSTVEMSQMWSKIRDQIIVSTTNSNLGPTVDIGPFPSLESMSVNQMLRDL